MTREVGGELLDLDRICERIRAAGFAAYVEQTGGGCATIYAGRFSGERGFPLAIIDASDDPSRGPAWPRYDCIAGPGWFEGPGWTQPYGDSADFYIGADDDGAAPPEIIMRPEAGEDAAVEAIIRRLRALGAADVRMLFEMKP